MHPSQTKDIKKYEAISKGSGSIIQAQKKSTSQGFDLTARNAKTNYHTSGVGYQIFNNQKFTKLKNDSRFRDNMNMTMASDAVQSAWSPDSPELRKEKRGLNKSVVIDSTKDESQKMYDIKGNTYKNTLIPKQTAISSALNFAHNTS